MTTSPLRSAAPRIAAEFLIIVVGVLVAFQVEGWRDAADARSRERTQLLALRADFEGNRDHLAGIVDRQNATVEAIGLLTSMAYDSVEVRSADEMRELWTVANRFQRAEPRAGAYDAMVSAGDLRLLRNGELRSQLAEFYAVAGEGFEDEAMADLIHAQAMAAMTQRIPLIASLSDPVRNVFGYEGAAPPFDATVLLRDDEYMGLMAGLGILEGLHLTYFRRLQDQSDTILALLNVELERDGNSMETTR